MRRYVLCCAGLFPCRAARSARCRGPPPGTLLYRYLWTRQLHSLSRPTVLLRLFCRMLRSDDRLHRQTIKRELPALRRHIERGEPVVLLPVRARGLSDPTANHQVVAVGYEEEPATGEVSLPLYDPNHPGSEPRITIKRTPSPERPALEQSTGERLRGFFILRYRPRTRDLPLGGA